MRALKNDPLDHFLICMATKKDPTGSFRIIYNAYMIIKRQNKKQKFISHFIIQSIIWKKKSLVIS